MRSWPWQWMIIGEEGSDADRLLLASKFARIGYEAYLKIGGDWLKIVPTDIGGEAE